MMASGDPPDRRARPVDLLVYERPQPRHDDEGKVQRLERLVALCPACHEVKHAGLASTWGGCPSYPSSGHGPLARAAPTGSPVGG